MDYMRDWVVQNLIARCLRRKRIVELEPSESTISSYSVTQTTMNTGVEEKSYIKAKTVILRNGEKIVRVTNSHPTRWMTGKFGSKMTEMEFQPEEFILPPNRSSNISINITSASTNLTEVKHVRIIVVYFWLGENAPNRNPRDCWRQPFLTPIVLREHIVFKYPLGSP